MSDGQRREDKGERKGRADERWGRGGGRGEICRDLSRSVEICRDLGRCHTWLMTSSVARKSSIACGVRPRCGESCEAKFLSSCDVTSTAVGSASM